MVNLCVLVIYQISYSLPMLVKARKLDVIFKLVFVGLNRPQIRRKKPFVRLFRSSSCYIIK